MQPILTRTEISKLKERLGRIRIAYLAAIEEGDCHLVAHLTCEAARLRDCINFASVLAGSA